MAGYIGGVYCDFVHGMPTGKTRRVDTWEMAGVNGVGVQVFGLGDSRFRILAVRYGAALSLISWANSILALKGYPIAIVTDFGTTYGNCFITKVDQPEPSGAAPYGSRLELTIEGVVG